MEWIRDNAEAFGGDLSRVTLFGQSAGAGMIDFYSYAYADDPIASGFILHSATVDGFPPLSNETTVPRWQRIAATTGCNSSNGSDLTTCMRGKTVQEIKAAFSAEDLGVGATPAFGPGTDDILVFENYTSRTSAAGGYLIGNNQNEAGLFRLLQPNRSDAYWQDFNDRLYTCADADRIDRAVEEGNSAWRYRYFGDFANIALSTDPPSGAYHGAEVSLHRQQRVTNRVRLKLTLYSCNYFSILCLKLPIQAHRRKWPLVTIFEVDGLLLQKIRRVGCCHTLKDGHSIALKMTL